MEAKTLLHDLRSSGARVRLDGDSIAVKGTLTDSQRTAIRQHKPELVRLLRSAAADEPRREISKTPDRADSGVFSDLGLDFSGAKIVSFDGEKARRNGERVNRERAEHRQTVLKMLADDPELTYALTSHQERDEVVLTWAIRDVATFEQTIPADSYDPGKLMEILRRGNRDGQG